MQVAALAVAKYPREFEYFRLPRRQQFLGCEFRRGAKIARDALPCAVCQLSPRRVQMGLIPRRYLQNAGFDLDKSLFVEPRPNGFGNRTPRGQKRPAVDMPRRRPPRRWVSIAAISPPKPAVKRWHLGAKSVCCGPKPAQWPRDAPVRIGPEPKYQEKQL